MSAKSWAVFLAVGILLAPAWGASVIAEWGFEQGLAEWKTLDAAAQLSLAAGAGQAAEGNFALHLQFPRPTTREQVQQRGLPGVVGVQLPTPFTTPPTCLEFSAKAKLLTPLLVIVNEADGSSYQAAVTLRPGQWEKVKLYLTDFRLGDDSTDENGRLDANQINSFGVADAGGLVVMLAEATANLPFRVPLPEAGDNELWLDGVRFTDEVPADGRAIEDAGDGAPRFLAILPSGARLTRQEQGLQGKPSWEIAYQLGERQVGLLGWPVALGMLADSIGLRALLRAEAGGTYIVQVKERDGSKYNYLLQLQPQRVSENTLLWANFAPDENSQDENGRLDPGQIQELLLIDLTAVLGGGGQANKLHIGRLEPAT
jgi:hypothetical protein